MSKNNDVLAKLTIKQRTKLFFKKCKSKEELSRFIQVFFGLHLPDCTVSRFADTNPLNIIWEVYDITVNKNNPEGVEELLYVAGRGSGKCALKGTYISTVDGPRMIENVAKYDNIYTGSGQRQKVIETFYEGIKPGIQITTSKGKKQGAFPITGSLRHRVQAMQPDGAICWKYLPDLKVGDYIYKTSEMSDIDIDVKSEDYEKGWIAGCISGDGHVKGSGSRSISLAGGDVKQMAHYANLVKKYFSEVDVAYSFSKRKEHYVGHFGVNVKCYKFKNWFESLTDGRLAYDKKLKTLEHSYDFLAGFFAGMMDTDGSKDSITLANKDLTYQLGQILNLLGGHGIINNARKKPRYSQIAKKVVEYYELSYRSKLPLYLLPIFSKRAAFLEHIEKKNEQFRYPDTIVKTFGKYIKDKYEIANGYWRLGQGKKTHSKIKYSKDMWGYKSSKESYIYGYKIDYFIELAKFLNEDEWVDKLTFFRAGYYEQVAEIKPGNYEFYDLEVENDHTYVSNGFISHNTLGMAIAELLIMLHDQRDCVHVGAILAQAKRCYEYQTNFMLSPRIRPIIDNKKVEQDRRILQKLNMEKSTFNIAGTMVTLEVLPCSLKACLVDTSEVNLLVDGEFKSVPLKDINPGDTIESPQGVIEVLDIKFKPAECMRVELEDGTVIEGTLDHKVWTDVGWIELQNLTEEHNITLK